MRVLRKRSSTFWVCSVMPKNALSGQLVFWFYGRYPRKNVPFRIDFKPRFKHVGAKSCWLVVRRVLAWFDPPPMNGIPKHSRTGCRWNSFLCHYLPFDFLLDARAFWLPREAFAWALCAARRSFLCWPGCAGNWLRCRPVSCCAFRCHWVNRPAARLLHYVWISPRNAAP